MNVMFLEKLVSLLMTGPESKELNAMLLVLQNFLLKFLHVLAAPVISASLDPETGQHPGPFLRAPLLRIEWNDAPGS